MKKLNAWNFRCVIALMTMIFSFAGVAQVKVVQNQNVGIGTDEPEEKLVVKDGANTAIRLETFAPSYNLTISSKADDGKRFTFTNYNEDFLGHTKINEQYRNYLLSYYQLSFYTGTSGPNEAKERMTILQNGNVGINHVSPIEKFHISGNAKVDGVIYQEVNDIPVVAIGAIGNLPDLSGHHNTLIGYDVSTDITSGEANTFVGSRSGKGVTDGSKNSAFGYGAGAAINSSGNTLIGYKAGYGGEAGSQQMGDNNTFVGSVSGSATATDSHSNSALGYQSAKNSTGNSNSFLGILSGSQNQGNQNIFVGLETGSFNKGNDNIFQGYRAGNNNGYIDEFMVAHGHNNIGLGYRATQNNDGDYNVALGKFSGYSFKGDFNLAIGYSAGAYASGNYNNYIGKCAGQASAILINEGHDNNYFGYYAGANNTTGSHNLFIGHQSGRDNSTGSENIYLGHWSGKLNTSGIGNIALGKQSLRQNTVGNYNTIIGYESGINSTGSGNVFIGNRAGYYELNNDRLYIENSLSSDPLIYGEFDSDKVEINGSLSVEHDNNLSEIATFRVSRLTAGQANSITNPEDGMIIYITSTDGIFPAKGFYGCEEGVWTKMLP